MQIKGKIKEIREAVQVSDKFKKREFIILTEETYPNNYLIQLSQDRCNLIDNYKVGQNVNVSINLVGKEWKNPQGELKYFTTLDGWKIEADGVQNTPPPQNQTPKIESNTDGTDDLLF
jgi:hypothetical protein